MAARRWLPAAALVVVLLVAASVAVDRGGGAPARGTATEAGAVHFATAGRKAVPELTGSSLTGGQVSLASLGKGRIVFINVWASWCTPCRAESPMLATAAAALQPRGVQFLGLDEDYTTSAGRAFAKRVGSPYPSLTDRTGSLLHRLTALPQSGIPSTLVVDRHGRVAGLVVGQVTRSQLDAYVTELSGET